MAACLLGMAVACAVFFPLKPRRREHIPPLGWWFFVIVGVGIGFYGMSHATAPSFSTPITAIGRAYDSIQVQHGRDREQGFRFVLDGGRSIPIETHIALPGWGVPEIFNGRELRVVYFDQQDRALKNEAIEIEILSGEHAGYRESFDARPNGRWLAVPIGATLAIFGYLGLKYMKDDEVKAAAERDKAAAQPASN